MHSGQRLKKKKGHSTQLGGLNEKQNQSRVVRSVKTNSLLAILDYRDQSPAAISKHWLMM